METRALPAHVVWKGLSGELTFEELKRSLGAKKHKDVKECSPVPKPPTPTMDIIPGRIRDP